MNKKLFSLGWYDAVKGLITAVLTAGFTLLSQQLDKGLIPTSSEWKVIAIAGASAGVAYILKQLLTNSNGVILQSEAKAAASPTPPAK